MTNGLPEDPTIGRKANNDPPSGGEFRTGPWARNFCLLWGPRVRFRCSSIYFFACALAGEMRAVRMRSCGFLAWLYVGGLHPRRLHGREAFGRKDPARFTKPLSHGVLATQRNLLLIAHLTGLFSLSWLRPRVR